MTRSPLLYLLSAVLAAACVPGGPIYVGPPLVILEGQVVALETREPIPSTEVCVFGADTLCFSTDEKGKFYTSFREETLLEGGTVSLRFRASGFPPAMLHLDSLTTAKYSNTNCAISNRVTLSLEPAACLPLDE